MTLRTLLLATVLATAATPALADKAAEAQVLELSKASMIEGTFFILMDRAELHGVKNNIKVGVFSNGELVDEVSTSFMGPMIGT